MKKFKPGDVIVRNPSVTYGPLNGPHQTVVFSYLVNGGLCLDGYLTPVCGQPSHPGCFYDGHFTLAGGDASSAEIDYSQLHPPVTISLRDSLCKCSFKGFGHDNDCAYLTYPND